MPARKGTLTHKIMKFLKGRAYIDAKDAQGLKDYHAAQAVKAAMRRARPTHRCAGVRQALSAYKIKVHLLGDAVALHVAGVDYMFLNKPEPKNDTTHKDFIPH